MPRLPYSTLGCFRLLLTVVAVEAILEPAFAQPQSERVAPIRPVVIWPSGPLDVVAAFDAAVDPALATWFVGKDVQYFEQRAPSQAGTALTRPLGSIRIMAARLSDGGRGLLLATGPHPVTARYVLPLPATGAKPGALAPGPVGASYDLSGVEVAWTPDGSPDDQPRWTGWWPLLDLEATRRLTRGSKRHEDGLALLTQPGRLVLAGFVRLPRGNVTVRITSSQPIDEAILGDARADLTAPTAPAKAYRATLNTASQGDPLFLSIICRTDEKGPPFAFTATYQTAQEKTDHAFTSDQVILPWAPIPSPAATGPLVVPDVSGGDPDRGQKIFNGDQARCSQCHAWRGQGGKVGPDLTEVGKKGRAELYRSIAAPSALIEPEFISYSVSTKAGQVIVGIVRAEGPDAIRVTDTNAKAMVIPRVDVDQVRPSANSIMPVGLTGALGDAAVRDVIAFLTSEPAPPPATGPVK